MFSGVFQPILCIKVIKGSILLRLRMRIYYPVSFPRWPKDLVALGNPHFSLEEHGRMVELLEGRQKHPDVTVVITSGPEVGTDNRTRESTTPLSTQSIQPQPQPNLSNPERMLNSATGD